MHDANTNKNVEDLTKDIREKKTWDKRIVLVVQIFLCIIFGLLFVFGAYTEQILVEGISSNCFTALVVTLINTIVDWNTETDVDKTLNTVEEYTNRQVKTTNDIATKLSDQLNNLDTSMGSLENLIDKLKGKQCTFCKNSIHDVYKNRDDCHLEDWFKDAKQTIRILATNLQSFTQYITMLEDAKKRGVDVKIATMHLIAAKNFNISRVTGNTEPRQRWEDMKDSLTMFAASKLEVRTIYNVIPTFILVIVDDNCFVANLIYKKRARDTMHFHYVDENILESPVSTFKKHFENTWNDEGTHKCELVTIQNMQYMED